ncbi:hypothetical protein OG863_01170 [Streptomyces decoyicus]|uniref:Transposase n=1 Tax=Streptomyces decoyicus TaxID=249567 RepID=A0ABZ1F9C3_9ACTN|nr:hypothetical protein [Streptomyces decoyicus]WSB66693.1 hypothetical protein OG863_01170 [Streptomyces decoyicus]
MASPTECTIGLIKPIDRYDVSRGVEFTMLAVLGAAGCGRVGALFFACRTL